MDREELATSKTSAGGRTHSAPPFSLDLSVQVKYYLLFYSHQTSDTVNGFAIILFQYESVNIFVLRLIRQQTY